MRTVAHLLHFFAKCPLRRPPVLPRERLTPRHGPFVYRLGRQVFNLERGVRFPYGLPFTSAKLQLLVYLAIKCVVSKACEDLRTAETP